MVAAGRHDIEFVNEALGYRSTQTIQVAPGQVAKVKPDWPQGTIAMNAAPWANVWLDGQELGETPVGNTTVPIGSARGRVPAPAARRTAHHDNGYGYDACHA